jgi:hypothetical protein
LVTVAHELAHALCQETDETRAKAYASQLSSTGKATCRAGRPLKPLCSSALDIDVSSAWTSARLSLSPTRLQFHERNLATRVSAREVWRL